MEDYEIAAFADGRVPKKYKELMGLAVSLNVKCYPCVQYHVDAAMQAGATREEIVETLIVAVALGGSVTQVVARFAMKVLERWEQRKA
ncbi:MAG: carboxymuconolactone decarboxylase family protein [Ignavibacteriales bacterium]